MVDGTWITGLRPLGGPPSPAAALPGNYVVGAREYQAGAKQTRNPGREG